jgi:alcohol dehydrogenase class IV
MVSEGNPAGHEAQDRFIAYLEDLTSSLRLARLADFGISEQDFDPILRRSGNKNNPVQLSRDELAAILRTRLNH